MKITPTLNQQAWLIRKKAAIKFSCPILEISWKHCLVLATEISIDESATKPCRKRAGKRIKRTPLYSEGLFTGKPGKSKRKAKRAGKRIDTLKPKCIAEIQRVVDYYSIKSGIAIPMPEIIDFKLKGKSSGRCWSNRISLHWLLLQQERGKYIRRTPGHEAVHYCEFYLYGDTSHGKRWKQMMVDVGITPEATHKYCTKSIGAHRPFRYYCNCRSHNFSFKQHERAQNRGYYWCSLCKTELVWEKD